MMNDEFMSKIIERLKREKEEATKLLFELGKEEGTKFAENAHWEDIQFICDWDYSEFPGRDRFDRFFDEDNHFKEEKFLNNNPHDPDWLNIRGEIYVNGWQDGVIEFWDKVKGEI